MVIGWRLGVFMKEGCGCNWVRVYVLRVGGRWNRS